MSTKLSPSTAPFVYMLIDCENNLPFFLGTMMDVGGEVCGVPLAPTEPAEISYEAPPDLAVIAGTDSLTSQSGNYTWSQKLEDGTTQEVIACGAHPLDVIDRLPVLKTTETTAQLEWAFAPGSITVQCWRDGEAEAESAVVEGSTLLLNAGSCVYEVFAEWEAGSGSYAFRVFAPE